MRIFVDPLFVVLHIVRLTTIFDAKFFFFVLKFLVFVLRFVVVDLEFDFALFVDVVVENFVVVAALNMAKIGVVGKAFDKDYFENFANVVLLVLKTFVDNVVVEYIMGDRILGVVVFDRAVVIIVLA